VSAPEGIQGQSRGRDRSRRPRRISWAALADDRSYSRANDHKALPGLLPHRCESMSLLSSSGCDEPAFLVSGPQDAVPRSSQSHLDGIAILGVKWSRRLIWIQARTCGRPSWRGEPRSLIISAIGIVPRSPVVAETSMARHTRSFEVWPHPGTLAPHYVRALGLCRSSRVGSHASARVRPRLSARRRESIGSAMCACAPAGAWLRLRRGMSYRSKGSVRVVSGSFLGRAVSLGLPPHACCAAEFLGPPGNCSDSYAVRKRSQTSQTGLSYTRQLHC